MEPTAHRRMPWTSVPASVRDAVAVVLGAPVVAAESQSGGFSPGSADRVVTASGRRAFVKTASTDLNAESVDIHRAEARVAALVPHAVDAPRLLGVVDHGGWIALVFEDVDGRLPHVPWRAGELEATLDAFAAVGRHRVPEDAGLPALDSRFAHEFAAWGRLGEEALVLVPGDLAAWARERFDDLDALARSGVEALRGDRLVHLDARADNVLVRPDGSVVLVDWPWAARGAGWFDVLGLLFNVRLYNPGFDAEAVIARHPGFADMSTDAATAVLAGIAGHFLEVSRRAPVPSIPTLRRFQHDQAVVCLQWVRERLE